MGEKGVKLALRRKSASLKPTQKTRKKAGKKQKPKQQPKNNAGKKDRLMARIKQSAAKQPQHGFWQDKHQGLGYEFNSVKQGLYKTSYYSCKAERKSEQQDFYNPVLNSRGVDELVRAAKIKNDYLIDRYVNPFLQEKFDSWKMLHRIDVQIRYVLEPYSAQKF